MLPMLTGKRPRAVVFDLDGLMFNTEELYPQVAEELVRRRGKAFQREVLEQMIGRPASIAVPILLTAHEIEDSVEAIVAETADIFAGLWDRALAPMPGLWDLLDTLERAGLPKAIATSSRRGLVSAMLARFALEPRFAFVLAAEDVRCGKPDPEIYLLAARRWGLDPQEVLVLEDSQTGFQAARGAGTQAVAVPGPHSRHHHFPDALLVLDTLADPQLYAHLGCPAPGRDARRIS